ncbi:Uncharacterized protein Rs2_15825 [Raphanus sativus]|nr:Uncharacterized protein Rs2_15825 [Raphanus sativus]
MTDVLVSHVVTMLKKKTVTNERMRIKYALLALLSAVILPTSHNPRISHAFVEKIKDLDEFLSYPWGRASFEMLISSIKERNEVSLSQNTIAFKGFVMAVQLVLIEDVPSLLGVVRDGGSSGSEAESGEDEDTTVDDTDGKKSINTGHVRDIDVACKAQVTSIISLGVELSNIDTETEECVEEEDDHVVDLVKAVEEGFSFCNRHFKGGISKDEVYRMREEGKKETGNRKTARAQHSQPAPGGIDTEYVANIVKNCVSAETCKMGHQIKELAASVSNSQNIFQKNMEEMLLNFLKEMEKMITNRSIGPNVQPQPDNTAGGSTQMGEKNSVDATDIIHQAMVFANNETSKTRNAPSEPSPHGEGGHGVEKSSDNTTDELRVSEQCLQGYGGADKEETVMVQNVVAPPLISTEGSHDDLSNIEGSPIVAKTPNANKEEASTMMTFPDPSFSIGLTQLNQSDAHAAVQRDSPGRTTTHYRTLMTMLLWLTGKASDQGLRRRIL